MPSRSRGRRGRGRGAGGVTRGRGHGSEGKKINYIWTAKHMLTKNTKKYAHSRAYVFWTLRPNLDLITRKLYTPNINLLNVPLGTHQTTTKVSPKNMLNANKRLTNNIKQKLRAYYLEERINPNHLYIMAKNTFNARKKNNNRAKRLPANVPRTPRAQQRNTIHQNRIKVWKGILNIARELGGSRRNVGNFTHNNPNRSLIQRLKNNIPHYSYTPADPRRYSTSGTGSNYVNRHGNIHTI